MARTDETGFHNARPTRSYSERHYVRDSGGGHPGVWVFAGVVVLALVLLGLFMLPGNQNPPPSNVDIQLEQPATTPAPAEGEAPVDLDISTPPANGSEAPPEITAPVEEPATAPGENNVQ
ncbi:hypothetical protein [Cucumibacter marinus]|uniref:hypothetical protein n=1 Tax=Cucumibacter marinus TaxID=1121252 RepID=UPI0004920B60|nr:hypothetical protein [Cucumibacter marinus]